MKDDRIIKFFENVLAKTKEGRIPWEPTAQESNFVAAIGGEFTLSVSGPTELDNDVSRVMGDVFKKYTLELRDMRGRIATVTKSDEGIDPTALRDLYETARWQAVHGGEKIKKALEVLKSL